MTLNNKNEFDATQSNIISNKDKSIESYDDQVETNREIEFLIATYKMQSLWLDENLEYFDYKEFGGEKEFLPTTPLEHRFLNRGCSSEIVIEVALKKIARIEDVVKNNDVKIINCGFKIIDRWLVKTCNILIFDSSEVDPETGRMVVWPDEQKFELGWEIIDLKADQAEPQS